MWPFGVQEWKGNEIEDAYYGPDSPGKNEYGVKVTRMATYDEKSSDKKPVPICLKEDIATVSNCKKLLFRRRALERRKYPNFQEKASITEVL